MFCEGSTNLEVRFLRAASVTLIPVLFLCFVGTGQNAAPSYTRYSQPKLLTYPELVILSEKDTVEPPLAEKLNALLTTPFVSNEAFYRGAKPMRPDLKDLGPSLRLVDWNIERGLELDGIKLALTDKQGFLSKGKTSGVPQRLSEQIAVLQSADVIVLNEVDWGMKRTDYRAVVKELGDALNMNWAYGVEFVEVDPKVLGLQSFADMKDEAKRKELEELFSVDQSCVMGLHGSAILSRYPIREAKLVPFKFQAYDWYSGEKGYGTTESAKRKGASVALGEEILREVRRGGRTNLIATLDVPDLPQGQVTVVATHMENRCPPKGRLKQAQELLEMVRPFHNPVVIAGDMNTTGLDASVSSVKSIAQKKATDPSYWTVKGIKYASGVGIGFDVVNIAFKQTKFQADPTASGVPLLAANPERNLFTYFDRFRFEDGTRLDFRGFAQFTVNNRAGTLADSNERGAKGFVTTYSLPRTLGAKGKFKLDWIFVKAYLKDNGSAPIHFSLRPTLPGR